MGGVGLCGRCGEVRCGGAVRGGERRCEASYLGCEVWNGGAGLCRFIVADRLEPSGGAYHGHGGSYASPTQFMCLARFR